MSLASRAVALLQKQYEVIFRRMRQDQWSAEYGALVAMLKASVQGFYGTRSTGRQGLRVEPLEPRMLMSTTPLQDVPQEDLMAAGAPVIQVTPTSGYSSESAFTGFSGLLLTLNDTPATTMTVTAVGPVLASEGQTLTAPVAHFVDSDTLATLVDYSATIDWGDGITSAGTVSVDPNGGYMVTGTHMYREDGTYQPEVTLINSRIPGSNVIVNGDFESGNLNDWYYYDDVSVTTSPVKDGTYAVGLNANHWYDGDMSQSFVVPSTGTPVLSLDYYATKTSSDFGWGGQNIYMYAGDYGEYVPVLSIDEVDSGWQHITIDLSAYKGQTIYLDMSAYGDNSLYIDNVRLSGPSSNVATVTTEADIAPVAPAVTGQNITSYTGSTKIYQVATFTDSKLDNAGDFSVSIDWGDGSSATAGTVQSLGNGVYSVTGSHAYAAAGSYAATVSVSDLTGPAGVGTLSSTVVQNPVAHWIGGASGDWNNAANWQITNGTSGLPDSDTDVIIDNAGSNTITISGGSNIARSITLTSNNSLVISGGSLQLDSASQIAGGLTLSGGTLYLSGSLTTSGATTWSGTDIRNGGAWTNNGTLQVSGGSLSTSNFVLNNNGTLEVTSGDLWINNGGSGTGSFIAGNGANLYFNGGTYTLGSGATLTGNGTGYVRLSSGTLSVTANAQASGFSFQGGSLAGSGALNLLGANNVWRNGTLLGALNVANGASLSIITNNDLYIDGGSLHNAGTITWTGSGYAIRFGHSAAMNNLAGATFDIQTNGSVTGFDGNDLSTLVFNNDGLLTRSAGTSTASFGNYGSAVIRLNNHGTIDVQSGALWINGSGSGDGQYTASGGDLYFNGSYTLEDGTILTGANGTLVRQYGGTLTLAGAVIGQGFAFQGGTIAGSGALTLHGTNSWSGGSLHGMLNVAANGALSIVTNNDIYLDGGTLNNAGITTWTGNGYSIRLAHSAAINNLLGATFDIQNNGGISGSDGNDASTLAFNNYGLLTHSSTSSVYFQNYGSARTTLNNTGTGIVKSTAGEIHFQSTTIGNGSFIADGGNLVFDAGTYTFQSGASFEEKNLGVVRLSGGTFTSASTVDIHGNVEWSGSLIAGTLNVANDGVLSIVTNGDLFLDGGTINNHGLTVWTGPGYSLLLVHGATINNLAGATFDIQCNGNITGNDGNDTSTLAFNNDGLLTRTVGTSSVSFNNYGSAVIRFNNTGTVDVQSGTLWINGSGHGNGQYTADGGNLYFGGNYTLDDGATLTGLNGSYVRQYGNTLSIAGAVAGSGFWFQGGTLAGSGELTLHGANSWNGGTLRGNLDIATNGTLSIVTNNDIYLDGGVLSNAGATTWSGTGYSMRLAHGAAINNLVGATFDIQNNGSMTGSDGDDHSILTFNNDGLVTRTVGTSSVSFNNYGSAVVNFNNSGTINVESGSLWINSAGSGNGQYLTQGGDLYFNGNYTLNNGAILGGTGSTLVRQAGGTLTVTGSVAGSGFSFQGGTLTGAGTLTLHQSNNYWSGGTLKTTMNVAADAILTLVTNNDIYLDAGTLNNSGTTIWTGAGYTIRLGHAASINNLVNAIFDIRSNGNITGFDGSDLTTLAFNNYGLLSRTTATGNTTFHNYGSATLTFNNAESGTVRVSSGSLTLSNLCVGNGAFVADGGDLVFNSGVYTFQSGATFHGVGTSLVSLASGIFTSASIVDILGGTRWSGSLVNGTFNVAQNADFEILTNNDVYLDGGTINNSGTTTWTGAGYTIRLAHSASINNLVGATFDVQANGSISGFDGNDTSVLAFNNAGLLTRTVGTSSTSFNNYGSAIVRLNNAGTLNVQSGALWINSAGTGSGSYQAQGGDLYFNGDYALTDAASLSGTSTSLIRLYGGTLDVSGAVSAQDFLFQGGNLAGAGTLTLHQNHNEWRGGAINGGTIYVASDSALLIASNNNDLYLQNNGTLTNAGTTTWTGGYTIRLFYGASIHNLTGGIFDIQSNGSITGSDGNDTSALTFDNDGLLKRTTGAGTVSFYSYGNARVQFNNAGTVDVRSGALSLGSGGVGSGLFTAAGGNLVFASDNYTLDSGAELIGTGTSYVRQAAGTLTLAADVTGTGFSMDGGLLAGPGTLSLTGSNQWQGGILATTLDLISGGEIGSNTTLTVSGSATLGGNGTITGGSVHVNGGGTLAPGIIGPGVLSLGNLILDAGANFNVDIDSSTPGSGYDQVYVIGSVELNQSVLHLDGVRPSHSGDQLILIANDGSDAISGTFANLAEGGHVILNDITYTISYHGGDGNDVVLTDASIAVNNPGAVVQDSTISVDLSDSAIAGYTFDSWVLEWGDGSSDTVAGNTTTVSHTYDGDPQDFVISATAYDASGIAVVTFVPQMAAGLNNVLSLQRSFSSLAVDGVGSANLQAAAAATGSLIRGTNQSIIVLNSNARGALTVDGNGQVIVSGGITVDSNNSGALTATGNAILQAAEFDIVGNIRLSGHPVLTGTVSTGQPALSDPLASLTVPAAGQNRGSVNVTRGTTTINPGTYSSISVSGNGTLILNPGIYIIQGGGFQVSGQGNVTGNGVCIINTSGTRGRNSCSSSIDVSGKGNINLSAMTSGTYAGVVFFQPRSNTNTASFSGNSTTGINGTIYTPGAMVDVTGNGLLKMSIAADKVHITGNGKNLHCGVVKLTGSDFAAVEGLPANNLNIASFYGLLSGGINSNSDALINWGDGVVSSGSIVANGHGGFDILGSHTYLDEGQYTVTVSLVVQGVATSSVTLTATVTDAPLTAGPLTPPVVTERQTFSNVTVFHFTDTNPYGTADEYSAVVTLGDGNTVTLTSTSSANGQIVANENGGFDVQLSYRYADELSHVTFGVVVHDVGGSSTSGITYDFNVAEVPVVVSGGYAINTVANAAFTGQTLATFIDPPGAEELNEYTASVDWGDGSAPAAGGITLDSATGIFTVAGGHSYGNAGSYTISITVTHGGISSTVTSVANVISPVINFAPYFTSNPYAGSQGAAYVVDNPALSAPADAAQYLQIARTADGSLLQYALSGADPDGDAIHFDIVGGPAGLTIQTINGVQTLVWNVASSGSSTVAAGSYQVRLRVTDSKNLYDAANDQLVTIHVIDPGTNHPPMFTSTPIVDAMAGHSYEYQATAFDPDNDSPLTFTGTATYVDADGQTVTIAANQFTVSASGKVVWTPPTALIGKIVNVSLHVDDGHGRSADQNYQIAVHEDPTNHAPVIVSEPDTVFYLPGVSDAASGNVTPGQINISLPPQSQNNQTVSLTLPPGASFVNADVFFLVDTTGSMGGLIDSVKTGFNAITSALAASFPGEVDWRFGAAEFRDFEDGGSFSQGLFVNQNLTSDLSAVQAGINNWDADGGGDWPEQNLAALQNLANNWALYGGRANAQKIVIYVSDAWGWENGAKGNAYPELQSLIDSLNDTDMSVYAISNVGPGDGLDAPGEGQWPGGPIDGRNQGSAITSGTGGQIFYNVDFGNTQSVTNAIGVAITTGVNTGIDLVVSDPTVLFVNHTGVVGDVSAGGTATFNVTFTGDGQSHSFNLNFVQAGTGVILGSIPVIMNGGYLYPVHAIDPDSDSITYSLSGDTHGATIDAATGQMTWQPTANGTYHFTVIASDGRGGQDSQSFVVVVGQGHPDNNNPQIDEAHPDTATVGHALAYKVTATDSDGDTLNYYLIDNPPAGMTIDSVTGLITWTPTTVNPNQSVTIQVTDGRGGKDVLTFSINVTAFVPGTNTAPIFSSAPTKNMVLGQTYRYHATARDAESDQLAFSLLTAPEGMAIDPDTGIMIWTPNASQLGGNDVIIRVSDGRGGITLQSFTLNVFAPNIQPHITSEPTGPAAPGIAWNYQVTATDPNGDPLTYTLLDGPQGASFSSATPGLLTWTPTAADLNTQAHFTIQISDGRGGYDGQEFWLTIGSNAAPTLDFGSADPVVINTSWSVAILASDPDTANPANPNLDYTLDQASQNRGMSIVQGPNGVYLTWTPGQMGTYVATVTVTDASGASTSRQLTLPVNAAPVPENNTPPEIILNNTNAAIVGRQWSYSVQVQDAEGDPLTLALIDGPRKLDGSLAVSTSYNAQTHVLTLTWTPSAQGAVDLTFEARDGYHIVTRTLHLPVEPNTAPVITEGYSSIGAQVGQSKAFAFQAYDAEGDALTAELVDAATGTVLQTFTSPAQISGEPTPVGFNFSYTPTSAGSHNLIVRITDSFGAPVSQPLTVVAQSDGSLANNQPPALTFADAQTIIAGTAWTLDVTGNDPDGPAAGLVLTLDSNSLSRGMSVIENNDGHWTIHWTPDTVDTYYTTVTLTDSAGLSVSRQLTLPVNAPAASVTNVPPEMLFPPLGPAVKDRTWTYTVRAQDLDGDPVTLALADGPRNEDGSLAVTSVYDVATKTLTLSWKPTRGGVFNFTIEANDGHYTVTQGFSLPVVTNAPPILVSGPVQAGAQINQAASYTYGVIDPNLDALSVSIIDAATGAVVQTPTLAGNSSDDPDHPQTFTFDYTPTSIGTKTFIIRIKDAAGATIDQTLTLIVSDGSQQPPTFTYAGRTTVAIGETFAGHVTASDPNSDPLTYSLVFDAGQGPVPTGMSISGATGQVVWTPTAGQLTTEGALPYRYRIAVSDGTSTVYSDWLSISVVSAVTNQAPEITSTPPTTATSGVRYEYTPTVSDPDNDLVVWFLQQGPENAQFDSKTGRIVWTPTFGDGGTSMPIVLMAIDSRGAVDTQSFTINVRGVNTPPVFTSIAPTDASNGNIFSYILRANDADGDPIIFTAAFSTIPSGADAPTFTITRLDGHSARLDWTNPQTGSYEIQLQASDGKGGVATQTVPVNVSAVQLDTTPSFTSVAVTNVVAGNIYRYTAVAVDPDGSPTYSLTALDASGNHVVALENAINTNTGDIVWDSTSHGGQSLTITIRATQNGGWAEQQFTLNIATPATNLPPTILTADNLSVAQRGLFSYSVQAYDPEGRVLTYAFAADGNGNTLAPAGMQIDRYGNIVWTADNTVGARSFTIKVTDDAGQTAERTFTVNVTADALPQLYLVASNSQPKVGDTIKLLVRATDDIGLQNVYLQVTSSAGSTYLAINADGTATFKVTGSGPYTFVAKAIDSAGQAVTQSILVTPQVINPQANQTPIVAIVGPENGTTISKRTDLIGRIYDPDGSISSYTITIRPASGGSAITIAQGTSAIGDASHTGVLATLDALTLANGDYILTVTAFDNSGGSSVYNNYAFTINTQVKVGNYSVGFDDLTTNTAGLPITIRRVYDSLNANTLGDFGYGWKLEMITGNLSVDVPQGNDPLLGDLGFQRAYENGTRISITLPDGTKRNYTAVLLPADTGQQYGNIAGSVLGLADMYIMVFLPDADSRDSKLDFTSGQNFSLRSADDAGYPANLGLPDELASSGVNSLILHYDEETNSFTDASGIAFNPATYNYNFRLTQSDGTTYVYNSTDGKLTQMTDATGNTVHLGDNAISSYTPSGDLLAQVQIIRDSATGRISKIIYNDGDATTPDELNYTYDANGDLVGFTDRTGKETRYEYNKNYDASGNPTTIPLGREHFLTRVIDMSRGATGTGLAVLTTKFNGDGQLEGLVDASGNSAGISYDLNLPGGLSMETATDALGIKTKIIHDTAGNVVRKLQQVAVGSDSYLVTVYSFDALNHQTGVSFSKQFATEAESLTWQPGNGEWQSRTVYGDTAHPDSVTSQTDASGVTTTYEYDARGNLTRTTDGLGNVTVNTYDSRNLLTQTIDAAGNVSKFGYDGNGNLTSVVQVLPDGSSSVVSIVGYDQKGNITSTTDSLGKTTYFAYDSSGNRTLIYTIETDPANTSLQRTLVSRTDYSLDGKIVGTRQYTIAGSHTFVSASDLDAYSPASATSIHYTSGGQLDSMTDSFGTQTKSFYDARGNIVETRSQTKDENGNTMWLVTRTAYDANGRVIATTDPFLMDASGQVITSQADIRINYVEYDGVGRNVKSRRLAGLQISITPSAITGYYDSVFAYTAAQVESATILRTQTAYDINGRVQYTLDAAGVYTYYLYDAAGREVGTAQAVDLNHDGTLQVTYNNGIPVSGPEAIVARQTYSADGLLQSATDALGHVTTYQYDDLGRVIKTIFDDGTSVQTIYDSLDRTIAEIDQLGRRTDYEYNDSGLLVAVTLPSVDADGSSTGTLDLRRPRYEYHYDSAGRKIAVVTNIYLSESNGQVYYYEKDANGADQLVAQRAVGASAETWPLRGNVTTFAYDAQGRQISQTLPLGNVTGAASGSFTEYNAYVSAEEAADASSSWHNLAGKLKYHIDYEGRVTAYEYDNTLAGGGRLKAIRYYTSLANYQADSTATSAARRIAYSYDAFGRQVQVTDTAFATPTTYTYDLDSRVIRIDSAQGILNYAYDTLGRQIATWTGPATTLANARTGAITLTEYGYDAFGRLTTTTAVRRFGQNVDVDPNASGVQPETTETFYSRNGQIDFELIPTAGSSNTLHLVKDYTYSDANLVTQMDYFVDVNGNYTLDAGESLLERFVYTYIADGSRSGEVRTSVVSASVTHTTTLSWKYDGLGHVVQEVFDGYDGGGNALAYTDKFTYDLSSNRIRVEHDDRTSGATGSAGADSVTTSAYDGNDRLRIETKDSVDNSHDSTTVYSYGTGNLGTEQTEKATYAGLSAAGTPTATTYFIYDATGRMTGVSITEGGTTTTISYTYDASGFRVEQVIDGVRTVYLIDPSNPTGYSQTLEEGTDANNNHRLDSAEVEKAYTLGLTVLTQATSTQVLHLLNDAHGSVIAALNAATAPTAASILQRYAYSAYGVDLGLAANALTAIRYAGQFIDPVTGLSFNRARWYDPASGRFMQRDPYRGSLESPLTMLPYMYGNGNPINMTDPTGNFSIIDMILTIAGFQNVMQIGKAIKTNHQASQIVENLVYVILGICAFEVASSSAFSLAQKGFAEIDYAFEFLRFRKRISGIKKETLSTYIPTLTAYLSGLPRGSQHLQNWEGAIGELEFPFLPGDKKGTTFGITFIPLTGVHAWDVNLSTAVTFGADIAPIMMKMLMGYETSAVDDLARLGKDSVNWVKRTGFKGFKQTWHHNEVMGVMELLDSDLHHLKGSTKHTGSKPLWEILQGKDYK